MKKLALSVALIMAFVGALRCAAQDKTFTIVADDWQRLQVTFNVGDLTGVTVIYNQETEKITVVK